MDTYQLQEKLFSKIKARLAKEENWVDHIADVLSLSKPAVYKRISGSTALSLHDLALLIDAYDISFDAMVQPYKENIEFRFPAQTHSIKNFVHYLQPVKYFVSKLSLLKDVEIWHATSELHLFYYFMDEDLTKFKMFLHAKTIWNLEGYENIKFSLKNFSGSRIISEEIKKILEYYIAVPNIELWNENIITNTLNQIKYFLISGFFENPDDALFLSEKLRSLVHHLSKMAEEQSKFLPGKKPSAKSAEFHLYHNELSYTNNIMIILSAEENFIFTTYNNPNFMISENETLIDHTKNWFQRVKNLSQPVSGDAAQSRLLLFNQIEKKINLSIMEIKHLIEKLT